jgi:hypothetical protein
VIPAYGICTSAGIPLGRTANTRLGFRKYPTGAYKAGAMKNTARLFAGAACGSGEN